MRFVKVGDISKQLRGVSYKKNDASLKLKPDYVPILRANNIVDGEIDLANLVYIPREKVGQAQYLRKGDVLIAASSGSLTVVGKAATVRRDYEAGFGAFCKVLRPDKNVVPAYFANYFQTHFYRHIVSNLAAGANINNLRNEHLDNLDIPLPPLAEQQRIAAILDKADALRAKRRAVLAKLDTLLQSVFLDMFGDPVTNPMGWEVVKLGTLGHWQSGGTPSRNKQDYFRGSTPWLSSGELEQLYTYSSQEFITTEAIANSNAKLIEVDSLLLGMYDTAAFKSTITKVICTCNQAIAFSKLNNDIANTLFVYYAIQIGKSYFKRLQRGVRQQNLNLSMIRDISIPFPPLAAQVKFAEFVNLSQEMRRHSNCSAEYFDSLFHALQQRAFKGDL